MSDRLLTASQLRRELSEAGIDVAWEAFQRPDGTPGKTPVKYRLLCALKAYQDRALAETVDRLDAMKRSPMSEPREKPLPEFRRMPRCEPDCDEYAHANQCHQNVPTAAALGAPSTMESWLRHAWFSLSLAEIAKVWQNTHGDPGGLTIGLWTYAYPKGAMHERVAPETCIGHIALRDLLALWELRAGGWPPSDGMPSEEAVAAEVHAAWMRSKQALGITTRKSESGEELMVPYAMLSEAAKELDRATVRAVREAESRAGGHPCG